MKRGIGRIQLPMQALEGREVSRVCPAWAGAYGRVSQECVDTVAYKKPLTHPVALYFAEPSY